MRASAPLLLSAACAVSLCAACSTKLDFDRFQPGSATAWDSGAPDLTAAADFPQFEAGISGCNPQSFVLKQAPPSEVYLVIDRSGSMAEASTTTGKSKWEELYDAIETVLTDFESTISFGLLMYPSDKFCKVSGPQVPVGLNMLHTIVYNLDKSTPAGGTPTAAALNNAARSLKDIGQKGTQKFLVLATDGGPNCNYFLAAAPSCSCKYADAKYCCTSYPGACYAGNTCLDETETLATIAKIKAQQQIATFVIGLEGSSAYQKLLNEMAKAGGVPNTSGTDAFYHASNPTQLQEALKRIAGSVISCEVKLEKKPDQPERVLIFLDGALLERNTEDSKDGWNYADAGKTTIELYGKSCEKLQTGTRHTLTATFPCEVK